jgi:hypothetical protein
MLVSPRLGYQLTADEWAGYEPFYFSTNLIAEHHPPVFCE